MKEELNKLKEQHSHLKNALIILSMMFLILLAIITFGLIEVEDRVIEAERVNEIQQEGINAIIIKLIESK